ncbi:MAG: sulfatase family protein [Planctomycetota bacterium]|jgi:arylsulfatase A-like enzyme
MSHRRRIGLAVFNAALVVVLVIGCDRSVQPPPPEPWNILLVTLDTCRADVIGCYGAAGAAQTPHLDSVARDGVLFERAYCQAPSTLPSHVSILTGLTPPTHGVHDNGVYSLGPEFTTLAETLQDRGYRTGAFVSAFVLDERFGLDQGFDLYDDELDEALKPGTPPTLPPGTDPQIEWWIKQRFEPYLRRAGQVGPRALEWMRKSDDRPFFLWVHFFDPHDPYMPPPDWISRYDPGYVGAMTGRAADFFDAYKRGDATNRDLAHMIARYRGEVSYADEWVGRLLATLDELGVADDTVVAVVGDHGEGLGEHGLLFEHNSMLYEELVRVPLMIRFPGGEHEGGRVASPVRTIDLFPTLIECLGLPAPTHLEGQSLLALVGGQAQARDTYFQALCEKQALPVPLERRGLISGKWKLIRTTQRADGSSELELYDLEQDRLEKTNLAQEEASLAEALNWKLDRLLASAADPDADHSLPLDEETRRKLRSLGYLP